MLRVLPFSFTLSLLVVPLYPQSKLAETGLTPKPIVGLAVEPRILSSKLTFRDRLLSPTDDDSTRLVRLRVAPPLRPLLTLDARLFAYDTSRNNPEHRCYDFRRPLRKNMEFLFNFLSEKKYTPNTFK